ncbi:MAG: hypothetical protein IIC55_02930 [Proteobacteria bacterium]|nr:hypothetical protein [Pseudomonadota bacterium]
MVKVVSKKDQARKKKKKIFRDVKTGRPSGITRGGRTFLGLSPEDVDVIAKDTRSPTDEEIKEKNKQLDAEESEVKSTLKLKPLGQTKEDGEKGFFGKTVEKVKEISDKFNLEKASGEEIQTGTIPIGPAGLFGGGAAAGIKAGPSIAEKGTEKAITFSSFLTKNYKNLDKADNILKVERSIQRLQKTFKIDRSAAIKIGKEFGTLKKKDMIQLLGKPNANALKTPLKTVGKIAAGLVGADTLISWLSVDNIIQGAAIFARDTASHKSHSDQHRDVLPKSRATPPRFAAAPGNRPPDVEPAGLRETTPHWAPVYKVPRLWQGFSGPIFTFFLTNVSPIFPHSPRMEREALDFGRYCQTPDLIGPSRSGGRRSCEKPPLLLAFLLRRGVGLVECVSSQA